MSTDFEKKKLKGYLEEDLYDMLKRYKCIVAGGLITSLFTNKEINDIDVYFQDKQSLSNFLTEEMGNNWLIAHTDKAFLFKYDNKSVQAIYFKYFQNANEIFDTFDFTVCMGAYDFEKEDFVLHENFLKDNASRILRFNSNTSYPIVSALRIDKYKKKGYTIGKVEFLRVMLTVLNSNITDYKTLKEQLGGMYGENYDKIIAPLENEEFDIKKIIEKMSMISVSENDVKMPEHTDIKDWNEFVCKVLGTKIQCVTVEGKNYRKYDGEWESFSLDTAKNKEIYEEKSILDVVDFPIIKYKYVKKTQDGRYFSFYDDNFEYEMGKLVTAKTSNGIHCVDASQLKICSYNSEKDRALLKLKIELPEQFIDFTKAMNAHSQFKSVKVLEELPLSFLDTI